jgi:quinol monooxygenase YgiN
MTTALLILTTHQIQPGSAAELAALAERYTEQLHEQEPGLSAHYAFIDEPNQELTLVQVHRDAASADEHVLLSGELIGAGTELAPTVRIQVLGEPGPVVRQAIARNSGDGVEVFLAGRPGPGFRR